MKSKFWNLLFIFLCCLLVGANYELVVPKHYDYYTLFIPRYSFITFFYTLGMLLFLGVYYYKKDKFNSIAYLIVLVLMTITNIWSFKMMNPFNEDSHIIYKGTSWQSHYPEPFYIFVSSFIIIGVLFLFKKMIDKRKNNDIEISKKST